ncbi:MAG: DUF4340 domain-containing protein [Aureispira sp.]|nr:DUF4340 domain-containing protein [Aureispira sp.]
MRRLIIPAILFIVLGLGTMFLLSNPEKNNSSTYNSTDVSSFHIEDISIVGKIFIADRGGNQALLTLEGNTWMYTNMATNQKYRARPDAVRNLLETVKSIRARNPVPKPAVDNVVKTLAAISNKVEIYDKDGSLIKTYYVGKDADEGKGTHMIMEGAERPYIVDIPNFIGSVHTRYIVSEKDWRDKAVFRINPKNLEYIQLEYQDPSQISHSFKLSKVQPDQYEVTALSDLTKKIDPSLFNNDNAATYFEDFNAVAAEKIVYNKQLRDSIITATPFLILSYKLKQKSEAQYIRVYGIYNPTADRGDGLPGHRQKLQRYYIDVDDNHFFLVQHLVFRRLLWGYDFFFRKAPVVLQEDEARTTGEFPENKESSTNQ